MPVFFPAIIFCPSLTRGLRADLSVSSGGYELRMYWWTRSWLEARIWSSRSWLSWSTELWLVRAAAPCSQQIVLLNDPSVSQSVFTIKRQKTIRHYANQPVLYDFCVGVPISCLLTVGSTSI